MTMITSDRPHGVRRYGDGTHYERVIRVDGERYGIWGGWSEAWPLAWEHIKGGDLAWVNYPDTQEAS